jgi:hypothetical protein
MAGKSETWASAGFAPKDLLIRPKFAGCLDADGVLRVTADRRGADVAPLLFHRLAG